MASILDKVTADLREAMKARDALRKNVLRSLKAAIDKEAKDKGGEADEATMVAVTKSQRKQRLEAAEMYRSNGEKERAVAEESEAEIIAEYLPEQLSEEELVRQINEAVSETSATAPADLGKVMGVLSGKLSGKADMKDVVGRVRAILGA